MKIFIGTAGYSYRDWREVFYPKSIKPGEMLEFYARQFSFTEINSTYYRLPSPYMFKQMVQKTPADFVFTIKAHQSLTHERQENVEENAKNFCLALEPLAEKAKLGAVLLQFPYSFRNQEENRNYLARLGELFKEFPAVVEFRHHSWIKKATWGFLQSLGLGYVCVDEPGLKGLVRKDVALTSETGYVRLHGRNDAKWWRHEHAYERYDYLYSREELQEWVPGVQKLAREAKQVFIAFNNHYRGQAVQNAHMFREVLNLP